MEVDRTPAEFEAALLLCALARVDPMARSVKDAAASRSAWIRGLALRLASLGPASPEQARMLDAQLSSMPQPEVAVGEPVTAVDRDDPKAFPRAA